MIRGQLAADMNAKIDWSSCLVEPVLVGRALLLVPVLVQPASCVGEGLVS